MIGRFKEFFELIRSKADADSAVELSWVFFGQLLNVILSFVILKLLSKMGTSDYGIYALVLTITVLLSLILFGPAVQGFIRFYYDYLGKGAVNTYISLVNRFLFVASGLLSLIVIIMVILSLSADFSLAPEFFLFAGIFIIAGRLGEFFNAFLNLLRRRRENALLQGAEKFTIAVVLFVLLLNRSLSLVVTFVVLSVITLLFSFIKIGVFRKNIPEQLIAGPADPLIKKEMRGKIVLYVFPFVLWGVSGWLQLNGEKWIIADLLSTSVVGIYAVMMSLVTAFIVVPANILADFTTPIIFQNYSNPEDPEKTRNGYLYIKLNVLLVIIVTSLAVFITAFWGKYLIIIISGADYALYWYLLPLLCFGTGLFYAGQALASLGMALNQPNKYLFPKILTGILSVVLNYLLILSYGIEGTAYAVSLTGMIYLFYIAAVNKNLISSSRTKA